VSISTSPSGGWKSLWHHFHQNKDWNIQNPEPRFFGGFVMTPLPPKQGLKPHLLAALSSSWHRYDTTSTKTRIETVSISTSPSGGWKSLWHHFHQNKDWNSRISQATGWTLHSLWHHFHQNKDWNSDKSRCNRKDYLLWHHFHQNKDWNWCPTVGRAVFSLRYDTTSTKTRIETVSISTSPSGGWKSLWHHFHQNKDWNWCPTVGRAVFSLRYDTTSTKTRIETHIHALTDRHSPSYDTTSTKTRIETLVSSRLE